MRSFIPWIDGKTLLAPKITAEFPESFGRYIEVFGGGASVLFSADRHAKFEVWNDASGDLVNLFRCVKYHRGELQREIRYYLNSREMFGDIRKRLECPGFTDIQRAAMFYVLVKTSFGANSRDFASDIKQVSTVCFDRIEARLSRVVIENKDFEELIRQYDRPDALFYCDPPYHTTERHYSEKFSEADHYRLNSVLIVYFICLNLMSFIRFLFCFYDYIIPYKTKYVNRFIKKSPIFNLKNQTCFLCILPNSILFVIFNVFFYSFANNAGCRLTIFFNDLSKF